MNTVLGPTALTVVRIDLDLAVPAAERAAAGDAVARSLTMTGLAHDGVTVTDDGVAVEVTLDAPDEETRLVAALAAWRVHLSALPSRGAPLPLLSLSARADALTAEPTEVPVTALLRHAPARVVVGRGDAAVATSTADLERRLAEVLSVPARRSAGYRPTRAGTSAAPPAADAAPRRRWARLGGPEGAGILSLALVRHTRRTPPPRSLAEHLADRVILAAFATDADGVLAAEVRSTGLAYSPVAELRSATDPAVLVVEAEVAPGDENAADAALARARARFVATFDAAAALARARGRTLVEADSLRGRLAAESRRRRRAAHIDAPDAGADDAALLDRLASQAVTARAAELFRADDFDALVLSPGERPDEWEEL
ncbi:hypothetical protein FBY40_0714 [Microbacterium sp. SLBN-154]|uniref:hypothetical protein n=1 Tax=Microbacterium sp. SLBN-154 TaxID=2768458 RepID=UPI0011539EAB|nr:hypothetical protein [Microbacterium sp. SLBN-154]TQK18227.1 hypothetical protein FBY40_0714 [Microbacterium sp. SLBN-154]